MKGSNAHRLLVALALAAIVQTPVVALAGEEDTHHWLTIKLARVCGFPLADAHLIASANWGMDANTTVVAEKVGVPAFLAAALGVCPPPNLDEKFFMAQRAQATESTNLKQPLRTIGDHLAAVYAPGPIGPCAHDPADVTALFVNSQQYRFHAFPTQRPIATSVPQLIAQQQVLEARFRNGNRSEKLVRFGQFLHFLQDKWFHWRYITYAGHGGPSINGVDPDSPKIAAERNLYRRMALDSMMWLGELALEIGQPVNSPCNDGAAGVFIGGPWDVDGDFDAAVEAELQVTKANRADVDALLNFVVKKSNPAFNYIPSLATAPVPRGVIVPRIVDLRRLLGNHIARRIDDGIDPKQYAYLKGMIFDANGDRPGTLPALNADPATAEAQLAAAAGSALRSVGSQGLAVAYDSDSNQTQLSGTVQITNDGSATSSPGEVHVTFLDMADLNRSLGVASVALPAIAPEESVTVAYDALTTGNVVGRVLAAEGDVLVADDGSASEGHFTDASFTVRKDGREAIVEPIPIVSYFPLPHGLIAPCAVDPDDPEVEFHLRVPKYGGPAGGVSGSSLALQIGDATVDIDQVAGTVSFSSGFERLVDIAFEPQALSSYFAAIPSTEQPEVLPVGVELTGQSSTSALFGYLDGQLAVGVSRIAATQPTSADELSIKPHADVAKSRLKLKVEDGNLALPDDEHAPTAIGARLRVFDAGGSAGDLTLCLPASGWSLKGPADAPTGYKYKGAGTFADPCKKIEIKQGAGGVKVTADCRAVGVDLEPPFTGSAAVRLDIGTTRYCAELTALPADNTVDGFLARDAAEPGSCTAVP